MTVTYTPIDLEWKQALYSLDDFHAVIGGTQWVIGFRTKLKLSMYGEDVICLSPKAYRNAQRLAHLRRTEGFG